jgi:hypothetical protein
MMRFRGTPYEGKERIENMMHKLMTVPALTLALLTVAAAAHSQTPIVTAPTGNQTVTQPSGTALSVNNLAVTGQAINIGGSAGTVGLENGWLGIQLPFWGNNEAPGIILDPTYGAGDVVMLQNQGFPVRVVDTDSGPFSFQETQWGQTGGYYNGNVPQNHDNNIFCVSTANDYTGVGGPNACDPYDIFDVSNRETFGDGYMHWYLNGVPQALSDDFGWGIPLSPNPGWNAGISNPSAGVLSFDTTVNGNAAAAIAVGKIVFPDRSVQTTAILAGPAGPAGPTGPQGPVGPAGAIGASPFSLNGSNASYTVGNVGIGTTSPSNRLQVDVGTANGGFNQGLSIVSGDGTYTTGAGAMLQFQNEDMFIGGIRAARTSNGYGGQLQFYTHDGTSGNTFGTNFLQRMIIDTTGNVGIGTTTPGAKLEVDGNLQLTAGSGASLKFQDGTTQSTAWTGTTCGGDYAESVDVSGDRTHYEPGDVIVIDPSAPGKFLKSMEPYSTLVSGIYSTKPGLVGRRQAGDPKSSTTEIPMAMVGIVPTKVSAENGPIRTGDLLVASAMMGHAMKGTDRSMLTGAVIGKALGNLDFGTGVIEVLVTLQ